MCLNYITQFKNVEFNNIEKLSELVAKDKKIVALIVEPIQGEAGVKFSSKKFLKKIEILCRKNNILFVLDEVQVGIGRTGRIFCHEHYNLKPDIINQIGYAIKAGRSVRLCKFTKNS